MLSLKNTLGNVGYTTYLQKEIKYLCNRNFTGTKYLPALFFSTANCPYLNYLVFSFSEVLGFASAKFGVSVSAK